MGGINDRARARLDMARSNHPYPMFFNASRILSALRRARFRRTYLCISSGLVQAYCRSAQPIAFCKKNSRDASDGSMQAYSKSKSVSALNPSWQMIEVRRFQRSADLLQASILRRMGAG